ncbi:MULTISPECIES: dephospho-CoA kinase [Helcococcus]|uniref:Dephospho-CoA kinase n=1 Tax=Helcococcus bovis TaxID=3153252 RepID=A0ABW9F4G9_9FIRM
MLKWEIAGMKSKIIGITGSIATGKSTVSNILKNKGYTVLDLDKIAHELMKKGEKNYINILSYFGDEILDEDGEIDRKKLGNIVFNDEKKLKKLNNLTHPNIFYTILGKINSLEEKIIFIDNPLLVELIISGDSYINYDEIWLVYIPKIFQIERLKYRDKLNDEDATKKINSQISIDDKVKYSDFIIDNSKDEGFLIKQINERLEKL